MSFRLPFSSKQARKDAHDELSLHIDGRIDELIRAGFTRAEAEREALRRFGDPSRIEAEVHQIDIATNRRRAFRESLDARLRDIRLAIRALARRPSYAIAVVLTLALGMGAATTIYTLLQRAVLDPLPYPAADRVVKFMNPVGVDSRRMEWEAAYQQMFHYAKAPGVERTGIFDRDAVNLSSGSGEPWRARLANVSVGVLDIIGARTVKGRLLNEQDDTPGAPTVAMLSWETWESHFGSDESIIGRNVLIDERPAEVIGVLAKGVELPPARGAQFRTGADIWTAHRLNPAGPFYNNHAHPMIGRLRPGVSLEQAQGQVDQLVATLAEAFPNAYKADGIGRNKFWTRIYPLREFVLGDAARNIWIAFAAVLLVLGIACANVMNLLLVRLETQRHEHAVRTALGAARSDIALEALAEGAVLVTVSALLGAALAIGGLKWLIWLAPAGIPRLEGIAFGWQAAVFMIVVSLIVALVFGVVAAMNYRGRSLRGISDGGRTATAGAIRQRVRSVLVATQVAFALVLVVSAGLLFRSFEQLRRVDAGVDPRGVLTVEWFLPRLRYDSLYKAWNFDRAVLEKVRAIPGVAAVGGADEYPLYDDFGCTVQGFEEVAVFDRLRAAKLSTCSGQGTATPGFFEAIGARLANGRFFTDDDNNDPSRGAVIVTKSAAERWWPGENPIGKGINPNGYNRPPFFHVVGVIEDIRGSALEGPPAIGVYYPVLPIMGRFWNVNYIRLAVRARNGDPMALLPLVRQAVHEVDPAIPLAEAEPMQAAADRAMGRVSFTLMLIAVAGIVALVLAAVGLYGVISYLVVRRTSEIGVRLALGAQAGQVEALVVKGALRMAITGVIVGLIGAFAASRVLVGLLYGVAASDPAAYVAATAVLVFVAAVAGWIPARRAAKLSPVESLRRG